MRRFATICAALMLGTSALAQTKQVTDDAGRSVEIPVEPKRIVALHEPLIGLPMMELGLNVVALYGRAKNGETLMDIDFVEGVFGISAAEKGLTGIGAIGDVDLELVRSLKPDLMVGITQQQRLAETFSSIAPVYLQDFASDAVTGFAVEKKIAAALGREDTYARLEADYRRRVDEVRATLPQGDEDKTYLAVIVFDQINVLRNKSGAVQALEDLGYSRAALPDTDDRNEHGLGFMAPLNSETFVKLDPDILVIMNGYMSTEQGEAAVRKNLDALAPGWDRFMKAAKEKRIVFANSIAVATPTIASARHMLDSIEEWSRQ
ncbi:iron ABC transporter periplasmic iron-binding protein [Nitratireductor aquibiodomus RA22]|uniref:Iron complex transport system substrate-binding protein n=2 Tax=Nitratireductor aquibiodomus TaxID=204799 RepID=A0A1H4JSR8_9HYPH|nr:ABC transporter substrate-binding protein [Nitratireductor aquibiodomus]EIM76997.1 iron ABC transporter periplasmic iron-binding protein [Nitratireductor aquibiodomus RA22]SEB49331.1 iron complex transport system substrate-binding protein [Nitratireductor aquibiodomus]